MGIDLGLDPPLIKTYRSPLGKRGGTTYCHFVLLADFTSNGM